MYVDSPASLSTTVSMEHSAFQLDNTRVLHQCGKMTKLTDMLSEDVDAAHVDTEVVSWKCIAVGNSSSLQLYSDADLANLSQNTPSKDGWRVSNLNLSRLPEEHTSSIMRSTWNPASRKLARCPTLQPSCEMLSLPICQSDQL